MASTLKKIVLLSFLLFQILVVPVNSQLDPERTNPVEFAAVNHLASTESYATVSSNAPEEENVFIDAAEFHHASASELADHARRAVTKVTKQAAAEEHQRLADHEEFQKELPISSERVKASKASAKNKKKSMAKVAAKLEEDMHIPTYRSAHTAHAIQGYTNEADILQLVKITQQYLKRIELVNQAEQLATMATQQREELLRQADEIRREVACLQQLLNAMRLIATVEIKVNSLQSGMSQSTVAYTSKLFKEMLGNVREVVNNQELRLHSFILSGASLGRIGILHELRNWERKLISYLQDNIQMLLQQIKRIIQEHQINRALYDQTLASVSVQESADLAFYDQDLSVSVQNFAFYDQDRSADFRLLTTQYFQEKDKIH